MTVPSNYFDECIVLAAHTAHEINRLYCEAIGDTSQVAWTDAPKWQRESAIKGVRFILEHPDATPASQHESWLAEKVADGWTYGPIKDPEKKQHPCMVPYEDLPPTQQAKDALFGATARGVLAHYLTVAMQDRVTPGMTTTEILALYAEVERG